MGGTSVHLVTIVHGMWGNPDNVATVAEIITTVYNERKAAGAIDGIELDVLSAQTNYANHTYDGIDWCGERVVDEIVERVHKLEDEGKAVHRFSLAGYSLGGLVGRYTLAALYSRGFFKEITPVHFVTFATPHLGIVRYPTLFSRLSRLIGSNLLSRTGEQFFAADDYAGTGRPLLSIMSDKGSMFFKALSAFPKIDIYANAVKDRTVPFVTAYIETEDPFHDYLVSGIEVKYDPKYKPLITSYHTPATRPPPPPPPSFFSEAYWARYKPTLPPFLQRRFPVNLLIYIALPLLIPVFLSMLIVRFSLTSRQSRRRIQLLEKTTAADESRLMHLLREMDQEMGNAVAEMIDQSGAKEASTVPTKANTAGPILSDAQCAMVRQLNTIPQMVKHIAYIHEYMNAHAVIICRDPKNFPHHVDGRAVIQHWVDGFEF